MNKNIFVSFILLFCLLYSCRTAQKEETVVRDFHQILQSDTLTIITLSTSYSYFIYREEAMGYDYELAKDFCDHYGLNLNVKVAENPTRLIEMLNAGEGDLVAYPVTVQNELRDSVIYCGPNQISYQVLVQRSDRGDTLITDVTGLIGKEVYVKSGTQYHQRMLNLDAELGSGIIIRDVEKDSITVEDLIEMVSLGEINYTVADNHVAKLNRTYFQNINIDLQISFDQRSSWVVRMTSPDLANALDNWVKSSASTPIYSSLYKKYFELGKLPFEGEYIPPRSLPKGSISVFDDLFKKYAQESGFDWYLLAAIAYQESHFRTDLTSWAGATGLMGLMPRTAVSLGISVADRNNPDLSIMASVKLLERLEQMFRGISDEEERLKFVLASYNGGNGHVSDARALARKYGENPNRWDVVEKYIKFKSVPEYYNDPVVKNGYFRGTETINYVREVMENWRRFRESFPNA